MVRHYFWTSTSEFSSRGGLLCRIQLWGQTRRHVAARGTNNISTESSVYTFIFSPPANEGPVQSNRCSLTLCCRHGPKIRRDTQTSVCADPEEPALREGTKELSVSNALPVLYVVTWSFIGFNAQMSALQGFLRFPQSLQVLHRNHKRDKRFLCAHLTGGFLRPLQRDVQFHWIFHVGSSLPWLQSFFGEWPYILSTGFDTVPTSEVKFVWIVAFASFYTAFMLTLKQQFVFRSCTLCLLS